MRFSIKVAILIFSSNANYVIAQAVQAKMYTCRSLISKNYFRIFYDISDDDKPVDIWQPKYTVLVVGFRVMFILIRIW